MRTDLFMDRGSAYMRFEFHAAGDRGHDNEVVLIFYGENDERCALVGMPAFCEYEKLPLGYIAGLTDVFVSHLERSQIGSICSLVAKHFEICGAAGPRIRLHGPRGLATRWRLMVERADFKDHPDFYEYTEEGEKALYQSFGQITSIATPFEEGEELPAYVGYKIRVDDEPGGVIVFPGILTDIHMAELQVNAEAAFMQEPATLLIVDAWGKNFSLERTEQVAVRAGVSDVWCSNAPSKQRGRIVPMKSGKIRVGAAEVALEPV